MEELAGLLHRIRVQLNLIYEIEFKNRYSRWNPSGNNKIIQNYVVVGRAPDSGYRSYRAELRLRA